MTTLNDVQRQAIEAGDGPVLVLAGAGTGKTRVIVERLAWLVAQQGVDPRNLLAVTFTNRAANEMRERVAERLGVERLAAWVGTFHSFGLFLLRREIERLGRSTTFTVLDDSDQLSLMKRLVKEMPAKYSRVSPRETLNWISQFKQGLTAPTEEDAEEDAYLYLWNKYHEAVWNANAVDFDDLLVLPARILRDHEDIRARYQRRYRYIHVDEYQDTNHAQFVLARELAGKDGNIFVVGDEDQSIYSWRGADLENILNFEQEYPGAAVIRLEQNYRSTQQILDCANRVVSHNEFRLGKSLWTGLEKGERVRLYEASSERDEAEFISDDIAERGCPLKEVAILFRTNGQARVIEETLRRAGLPYRVFGGTQFYSRKEIKDILAYLRLLVNPADDVALRRVINVPTRGIGATTLQRVEEYAQERGLPLLQVLREIEDDQTLSGRARNAIGSFVHLMDDLAIEAKSSGVADLVEQLLEKTGYRRHVEESDAKDFRERIEIVDEFVSSCKQFDADHGGDLLQFLQDMALVSDGDQLDPEEPTVTLMTCHSAKGLEFDHVYIAGLEENLLPHASSLYDSEELEEERRLCYVAMTRARKTLTLTYARGRVIFGEPRQNDPSRFMEEIGRDHLDPVGVKEPEPARRGERAQRAPAGDRGGDRGGDRIKMGTQVHHAKFGRGTVMFTSGSGKKLRAKVRFQSGPTRDILVEKAPLEILEGNSK